MKWVLMYPTPSEADKTALVDGLRGYLDSAKRLALPDQPEAKG
jgi:hypothetical protein